MAQREPEGGPRPESEPECESGPTAAGEAGAGAGEGEAVSSCRSAPQLWNCLEHAVDQEHQDGLELPSIREHLDK